MLISTWHNQNWTDNNYDKNYVKLSGTRTFAQSVHRSPPMTSESSVTYDNRDIGAAGWFKACDWSVSPNPSLSCLGLSTTRTFWHQGYVKGAILFIRNLYFYFRHGESTSTASQLTFPASQKSKDLNKVPLLLQDLDWHIVEGASSLLFNIWYWLGRKV